MKRIIALILALLLFCLSFAGCTLEKQRQSHLKFDENGNISFNGHTYILLDESSVFLNPAVDSKMDYYLTEPDVPVLQRKKFGTYAYVSLDGKFVYSAGMYYCRSDVYAEVEALLKQPECMQYFCMDWSSFYDVDECMLISLEDTNWFKKLIAQLESGEEVDSLPDDTEILTQIYACDKDMILKEFVCTVYRSGRSYYLRRYDPESERYAQYCIPAEDTPRFAAMLENPYVDYKSE